MGLIPILKSESLVGLYPPKRPSASCVKEKEIYSLSLSHRLIVLFHLLKNALLQISPSRVGQSAGVEKLN